MEGKLQPTHEEQMKAQGHGTLIVTIFHIQHGTIGKGKDAKKYRVDANPKDIVVRIGKREVLYSVEELVRDSAEIIEKAERKE